MAEEKNVLVVQATKKRGLATEELTPNAKYQKAFRARQKAKIEALEQNEKEDEAHIETLMELHKRECNKLMVELRVKELECLDKEFQLGLLGEKVSRLEKDLEYMEERLRKALESD